MLGEIGLHKATSVRVDSEVVVIINWANTREGNDQVS